MVLDKTKNGAIRWDLQEQKFFDGFRPFGTMANGVYLQEQKFFDGFRQTTPRQKSQNLQEQKFFDGFRL